MMDFPGWDIRSLYEQPPPDLMEAEAFFSAFARLHDLDGHSVECIVARAKHQPLSINQGETEGVHEISSVVIVRESDMAGAEQGGSLRIDGTHCRIERVSHPISGITRLEVAGVAG